MSPRAACRLETLGFPDVHDYVAGKADWLARGLPPEGEAASERRALDVAVHDVVTCGLEERVGDVRERIDASRYGFAFVLSPAGVLLGRLRRSALDAANEVTAEAVMEPGPSTIRADARLPALAKRMQARDLTALPITDPDGNLLGLARRDDIEQTLRGEPSSGA